MQPYDGGTPEVVLCFEHRGVEYEVDKRFGAIARARRGSSRASRRDRRAS